MAGKRGAGDGTIRLRQREGRPDLWEARITLADGSRKSLYGATRDEARRKLAQATRDRDRGMPHTHDERQTVAVYLHSWLAMVRPNIEAGTWLRYEALARLHIIPALGRVRLATLSPQQVQRFYSDQLDEYASTTVKQMHVVLHQMLDTAMRHGLVARNVTTLVDAPKVTREEMQVWNPDQARAFLAIVEGDRFEALYRLALATCLRQGELLGLCWRNLDLDAGVMQVQTALKTNRLERGELHRPKTRASRRRIRLPGYAVAALRAHHAFIGFTVVTYHALILTYLMHVVKT